MCSIFVLRRSKMASGSYAKKLIYQESPQTQIPPRATRPLPSVKEERETTKALPIVRPPKVVDEFEEHPLTRHLPWLRPFVFYRIIGNRDLHFFPTRRSSD